MKNCYKIDLNSPYSSLNKLFVTQYNSRYTNSYVVETPYKQTDQDRDVSRSELHIFYDQDLTSVTQLQAMIDQIKKLIADNVSTLVNNADIKQIRRE